MDIVRSSTESAWWYEWYTCKTLGDHGHLFEAVHSEVACSSIILAVTADDCLVDSKKLLCYAYSCRTAFAQVIVMCWITLDAWGMNAFRWKMWWWWLLREGKPTLPILRQSHIVRVSHCAVVSRHPLYDQPMKCMELILSALYVIVRYMAIDSMQILLRYWVVTVFASAKRHESRACHCLHCISDGVVSLAPQDLVEEHSPVQTSWNLTFA